MYLTEFNRELFNRELVRFAQNFINKRLDIDLLDNFKYALKIAAPFREKAYIIFETGKSLGVAKKRLKYFAFASELIMVAALTADDVFDKSQSREGKLSLYKRIGVNKTILVSEFIFSLAMKALVFASKNIRDAEVSSMFIQAYLNIQKSQYRLLAYNKFKLNEITPEFMDCIAYLAAGNLFEASIGGIAYLNKDINKNTFNILKKIGGLLGTALQHNNDISDFTWSVKDLGRLGMEDLYNGQANLVLAYFIGMKDIKKSNKSYIQKIWNGTTKGSRKRAMKIIVQSGAIECAKNHLTRMCTVINKEIRKINNENLRVKLEEITNILQSV